MEKVLGFIRRFIIHVFREKVNIFLGGSFGGLLVWMRIVFNNIHGWPLTVVETIVKGLGTFLLAVVTGFGTVLGNDLYKKQKVKHDKKVKQEKDEENENQKSA